MAVMANTMAMAARERTSEYATLKALGFGPGIRAGADLWRIPADRATSGECSASSRPFPLVCGFGSVMGKLFPVFQVSPDYARAASWRRGS